MILSGVSGFDIDIARQLAALPSIDITKIDNRIALATLVRNFPRKDWLKGVVTLENIEDTSHYDILKSRIQASIETAQNLKQEIQAIETYIVTKHTEVGLMNMRMAVNRLATQLGM